MGIIGTNTMRRWLGCAAAICVGLLGGLHPAVHAKGTIDWMEVVQSADRHNAFTDLVYWKDWYYLCFRQGASHNSLDGAIWVVRSKDLLSWELSTVLATGGDDRDPHFAATPGRLYVYFGTWSIEHGSGSSPPDRRSVRSHFSMTTDGQQWSEVFGVYEPGWWLWRVRYLDGTFYSAAYTAVRPRPSARETRLLKSEDGLVWEQVSVVTDQFGSGEADFWFEADGTITLLTRTDGNAILFRSDASLEHWEGRELSDIVHSPVMAEWKGRRFVAGRGLRDGNTVTKIWELEGHELRELLVLPSGGDTAYPGLVVDPASLATATPGLFVTWYSQMGPGQTDRGGRGASVYAGRVTISP